MGTACQETEIRFYSRTKDAWEAMYKDCLEAKKSIKFEQYIVHNDEIGKKFMSLFSQKLKEGVSVDLLLDRVGSRGVFGSGLLLEIIANGGKVRFYNPIGWINFLMPSTWFPRNHTKIMIIDSEVVHIGSVCLADYMAEWRDLSARITGCLVQEITKDFCLIWKRAMGRKAGTRSISISDDPDFDYLVTKPRITPSPIYRELLSRIHHAEKYIYMATPYFLPPQLLRRALQSAARRGVDIRVILTEQTDVPLALNVSRTYFPQLLREGIRIFSYKRTVFHAKYTIIDGKWATMGSVNLDYLSLLENREANIVMTHEKTVRDIEKQFRDDLSSCEEITPGFWRHIGVREKIIGYLGRSIKRMI